jgi:hypothetical protein
MKTKRILRVLLTLAALAVATAPVVESSAFADTPRKTSNPDNRNKQAKIQAAQKGKAKARARQELTGRGARDENGKPQRQGNHDSLTKPEVRGGPKGDRHANGIRQAGTAGKGKGKGKGK